MKNKTRRFHALLLVAVGLLIGSAIFLMSPCPINYGGVSNDAPVFVQQVSPAPNAEIRTGCFARRNIVNFLRLLQESFCPFCKMDLSNSSGWVENGGLSVRISGQVLVDFEIYQPKNRNFQPLEHRVFLQIDEKTINPTWVWTSLSALLANPSLTHQYIFIYHPFLLPGDHTARITYLMPNGKTLNYEWHFTITWW